MSPILWAGANHPNPKPYGWAGASLSSCASGSEEFKEELVFTYSTAEFRPGCSDSCSFPDLVPSQWNPFRLPSGMGFVGGCHEPPLSKTSPGIHPKVPEGPEQRRGRQKHSIIQVQASILLCLAFFAKAKLPSDCRPKNVNEKGEIARLKNQYFRLHPLLGFCFLIPITYFY